LNFHLRSWCFIEHFIKAILAKRCVWIYRDDAWIIFFYVFTVFRNSELEFRYFPKASLRIRLFGCLGCPKGLQILRWFRCCGNIGLKFRFNKLLPWIMRSTAVSISFFLPEVLHFDLLIRSYAFKMVEFIAMIAMSVFTVWRIVMIVIMNNKRSFFLLIPFNFIVHDQISNKISIITPFTNISQ
jgi:hypothetical protein